MHCYLAPNNKFQQDVLATCITRSIMNYQPIDRASIADAVCHLEEARRTKDADKIARAVGVLRERLLLIRNSILQLYATFAHQLEGNVQ